MFEKIVGDMRDLKISGAENIAKAAIKAISDIVKRYPSNNKVLYKEILFAKGQLEKIRPAAPCLKNTLKLLFNEVEENRTREQIETNIKAASSHFRNANPQILGIGARKIRKGMVVFTHGHSDMVVAILKTAKKKGMGLDRKSTRLNSSHTDISRMPSSA